MGQEKGRENASRGDQWGNAKMDRLINTQNTPAGSRRYSILSWETDSPPRAFGRRAVSVAGPAAVSAAVSPCRFPAAVSPCRFPAAVSLCRFPAAVSPCRFPRRSATVTAEVLIISDLYTLLPRISRKQNALSIDCQAVKCHRKMEEAGRLPPDSVVPAGHCADARLAGT